MKKALTFALTFCSLGLGLVRSNFAQENAARTTSSVESAESGSREQDKLKGPVRRVRVETSKVSLKDGQWVEGSREILGITTYDPTGKKIDTTTYPVGTSLPGKEQYLYDDKGNIVEMILLGKDGSVLSKESYNYEFDQLGNWTKMSSSVAVFENGKIIFEPTGITYRSISYYYSQAFEKLNAPSPKTNVASIASDASTLLPNSSAAATESPRPAAPTPQIIAGTQPEPEAANAHAKKELVGAPASIVPAKTTTAASGSPASTSSENNTTPDDASTATVVQHVAEDALRKAAIELPAPEYSRAALMARASGKVKVQILVDENGNVTNAQATSGHPLLGAAAEAAARKARFSLAEAAPGATRVYGVISYEFVPPAPISETVVAPTPTSDKNQPIPEDPKTKPVAIPEKAAFTESKPKAFTNYAEAAREYYDKGVAFQAAGHFAEAAEAFNQAIKTNPNDANAYARLGMAYSALEKHKDAVIVYKMAVHTNRDVLDAPAYYMWGHSYLALGKNSDALSAFKQALYITRAAAINLEGQEPQRYPSLEQLHYGMGIANLNSNRFGESISELKQVVTLNPKNAEAYYALAIAYLSNGNRREAEKQQRTLSSLNSALAEKLTSAFTPVMPPGCRTIVCR